MYYAKIHCLLVCLVTAFLGVFVDRSVPYYPIEISRTCSGPWSREFFKWGSLSIIFSILALDQSILPPHLTSPIYVWASLVMIAWFDDQNHFILHNVGVSCLLGCVMLNVFWTGDIQRKLPIFWCACILMGASVAIKGIVIVYTEHEVSLLDWRVWWRILWNVEGFRDKIVAHTLDVMYQTDASLVPLLTLPAFRMTGVLQWMSFYIMSSIYY